MSLNKVMLIGNVGQDPRVRYLEGNSPDNKVATFTLATTERYHDRSGEVRENTEWHNIVAWRGLASTVEKYVRKGSQLYIEGKLRTRSWEDQNHAKRYTTEIYVDSLQILGRRSDNPGSQASQQAPASSSPAAQAASSAAYAQQYQAPVVPPEEDDDLPF